MFVPSKILLSFVIPATNDPRIRNAISSIISTEGWNSSCELIVILSNCHEHFYKRLRNEYSSLITEDNVKILCFKEGNIAQARNIGIKLSRGQYIVYIDSDCQIAKNYITALKEHLFKRNFFLGRGITNFIPSNHLLSKANCQLKQMVYFGRKEVAYTPNLIVKRDLYKKIGFFDEELFHGEDTEWDQRLKKWKIAPIFLDDLIVRHFDHRNTLKILITYFYYGVGRTYRFKKHFLRNRPFLKWLKNLWLLFNEFPNLRKIDSLKNRFLILFLYLIRDIGVLYGLFKWNKIK